jgi:hypothetical protein
MMAILFLSGTAGEDTWVGYTEARGEVAQSVEHTAENRGVAGSIPALAMAGINGLTGAGGPPRPRDALRVRATPANIACVRATERGEPWRP